MIVNLRSVLWKSLHEFCHVFLDHDKPQKLAGEEVHHVAWSTVEKSLTIDRSEAIERNLPEDPNSDKLLDFFRKDMQAGRKYETIVRDNDAFGIQVNLIQMRFRETVPDVCRIFRR